jgi:D-alanyl-D-alanine carboxypeptidase/D-alanyl-D-alanine-endopeptidase (penicillin-binding protein 4)
MHVPKYISLIVYIIYSSAALGQKLPELSEPSNLKEASWGFALLDEKGEVLVDQRATRMLATASVMKVITAATAFDRLGTDFHYETSFGYNGKISGKTLVGDLIIKGSGDPSLGSDRFPDEAFLAHWAESLRLKGITTIQGDVIADISAWSSQITPDSWPWQDLGNYYAAGASALNFQENLYSLYLNAGARVGAKVELERSYPELPNMVFNNELTTGPKGSGDQAYIYGAPYSQRRYLRGTIPLGATSFRIKGAIPDPARNCVKAFSDALMRCGISVEGKIAVSHKSLQLNIVDKKVSPSLSTLVTEMNMHSINLYAECLLKTVSGKGNTAEASDWLIDFWKAKGVNGPMRFADGSGLSGDNAASPLAIAQILHYASQQRWADSMIASLPEAGKSGSLKNRFKGTTGYGRIFAKTGTTGHVRSLAGYIHSKSGRKYSFCLLINHYKGSGGRASRALDGWLAAVAEK